MPFPQSKESTIFDDGSYESTVIVETVSQELDEGVIGIRLRNQPNPSYEVDNSGRTKYYNQSTHVSNNWPSFLGLQAYAQITWAVDYKGRWYQSWLPWFGDTWCCYEWDEFDIDGPYRVRLHVAYDYYGDYYYEYFY